VPLALDAPEQVVEGTLADPLDRDQDAKIQIAVSAKLQTEEGFVE
jgi:hypothetical protein